MSAYRLAERLQPARNGPFCLCRPEGAYVGMPPPPPPFIILTTASSSAQTQTGLGLRSHQSLLRAKSLGNKRHGKTADGGTASRRGGCRGGRHAGCLRLHIENNRKTTGKQHACTRHHHPTPGHTSRALEW
ncbi:hypothetical protein EYF80_010694 [Liparis tanakae]|uniref:Uncharacterized protein n=1 Tax=Liparis tanakae TaxID=230148 RepID=A0A4Z2IMC8_9TELE|nr:hypothetical protein EYF80_010694 [Liparis tanakae]